MKRIVAPRRPKLRPGPRTAESQRWKRREMLVRQQVANLARRADQLEHDALSADAERDVLARERDILKAATAKASQRSGYSVLPYKGPNGTWRRPIVLECSSNTVTLRPRGQTFSMLDLSPLINPRTSPVILAIAKEMLHIQQSETPDGAPAVPYLVFLVRPDGIRPYYQARGRLESLGVAFGYELIEQELAVEFPNFDDLTTWDGTAPLETPELASKDAPTRPGWPSSSEPQGKDDGGGSAKWPAGDRAGSGDRTAAGDPAASGTWPPEISGDGKPGTDRRWPDLARGDPATGGTPTGSSSPAGGMGGTGTAEIDVGGNATRGGRSNRGGGDGSPDDFVWPSNSGDASPGGGRGSASNARGNARDGGTGNTAAGTLADGAPELTPSPGFAPGPGSADPGSRGGGSGPGSASSGTSDRQGGSLAGRYSGGGGASSPGGDLGSTGTSGRGASSTSSTGDASGQPGSYPQGGGPLSPGRFGVSGRGTGSPSGGPMSRGGNDPSNGGGTGSGLKGDDPLPDLEPARDGPSQSGSPTSRQGSTLVAAGPGGSAAAGSRSGKSEKGGGPADASGRSGQQPTSADGQPDASPSLAGNGGTTTTDPGFAAYAGGSSAPVESAGSPGSPTDGGPTTTGRRGPLRRAARPVPAVRDLSPRPTPMRPARMPPAGRMARPSSPVIQVGPARGRGARRPVRHRRRA